MEEGRRGRGGEERRSRNEDAKFGGQEREVEETGVDSLWVLVLLLWYALSLLQRTGAFP